MSNANLEKNLAIFYTFYATILLCYSFLGSVFFVISFLVHRWLICQNKETVQQTFEKVCIFCDKHKQHLFPLQLIRLECPKGVKTKSIGSRGPLSIFLKEILRQYFWQIGNIAGVASPQLRLIQPPSSSTTDSICIGSNFSGLYQWINIQSNSRADLNNIYTHAFLCQIPITWAQLYFSPWLGSPMSQFVKLAALPLPSQNLPPVSRWSEWWQWRRRWLKCNI